MDEREQDKVFQELLARGLRQESPKGGADCPDAEILAAYYDHSLSAPETSHWESHFSACARCQQVLSALAVSDAKHVPAEAEFAASRVAAMADVRLAAAPQPAPAAAQEEPRAAGRPVISGSPKYSERARRTSAWRWLAIPVAAAAVAVLWFEVRPLLRSTPVEIAKQTSPRPAVNEEKRQEPNAPPPATPQSKPEQTNTAASSTGTAVQVAKNEPPPPPKYSRKDSAALTVDQTRAKEKANSESGQKSQVVGGQPPDLDSKQHAERDRATAQQYEAKPSDKITLADQERRANQQVNASQQATGDNAKTLQGQLANQQTVNVPAPASRIQRTESLKSSEVETNAAAGRVGEPVTGAAPPGERALKSSAMQRKLAAAAPGGVADASSAQLVTTMEFREVPPALAGRVASPGKHVLWRLGVAGKIERSLDSGATWQAQASNADADLVAGWAPKDTICWVVGLSGTILRTTDGEHWEKIASPAPLDWTAVIAKDALRAAVRAAAGESYSTSDGGKTWRIIPKQ